MKRNIKSEAKHSNKEVKSKSQSPAPKAVEKDVLSDKKQEKKSDKKVEKADKTSPAAADKIETRSESAGKIQKPRKSELRTQKKVEEREHRNKEREYLESKYDINLRDSDDSSDEENLLRNGNVPKQWYDLYDHKGYSVKGGQVDKMAE